MQFQFSASENVAIAMAIAAVVLGGLLLGNWIRLKINRDSAEFESKPAKRPAKSEPR